MYHGNDLHTRIRSGGKLSVEHSRTYASELVSPHTISLLRNDVNFIIRNKIKCSAIVALHGAGIVHGDLRPEHVLFDHDDHVVLTDFSCATFVGSSRLCLAPPNEYQAPEALLGWALHYSVDCWAFGVLLHVMLFGKVHCCSPCHQVIAKLSSQHPFAHSSSWQDLSEMRKSVISGPTTLGAVDGDRGVPSSAIILLKKVPVPLTPTLHALLK
jgi:serine/threonine protein kinase